MAMRVFSEADLALIRERLETFQRRGGPDASIRLVGVADFVRDLSWPLSRAELMITEHAAENLSPEQWRERHGGPSNPTAGIDRVIHSLNKAKEAWTRAGPEHIEKVRLGDLAARALTDLIPDLTNPSPAETEGARAGRPQDGVARAIGAALARDLVGRMTYHAVEKGKLPTLPLQEASWFVWLVSVLVRAVAHPGDRIEMNPPRISRTLLHPVVMQVLREYERLWDGPQRKAAQKAQGKAEFRRAAQTVLGTQSPDGSQRTAEGER